jgi:hypothetical protein
MIHYPEYISKFNQSKNRLYPSESELLETNPHLKGMSAKKRKEMQRHHINCDRQDGRAENIHVVDSLTHTQLHQQLQQIITELIKKNIIGYDRRNPHYFIKDEKLLEKFVKPKVVKDDFRVERVERAIGNALAQFDLSPTIYTSWDKAIIE